jgi:predicted enzyme involved in methoxymalonyl-ACP biosynthesis
MVDHREARMTDLTFSCRLHCNSVEHAFLAYLLRKYTSDTCRDSWANYDKTSQNAILVASSTIFE